MQKIILFATLARHLRPPPRLSLADLVVQALQNFDQGIRSIGGFLWESWRLGAPPSDEEVRSGVKKGKRGPSLQFRRPIYPPVQSSRLTFHIFCWTLSRKGYCLQRRFSWPPLPAYSFSRCFVVLIFSSTTQNLRFDPISELCWSPKDLGAWALSQVSTKSVTQINFGGWPKLSFNLPQCDWCLICHNASAKTKSNI